MIQRFLKKFPKAYKSFVSEHKNVCMICKISPDVRFLASGSADTSINYSRSGGCMLFRFTRDIVQLGNTDQGLFIKFHTAMNPRVHLVPYHFKGGQPSYLLLA